MCPSPPYTPLSVHGRRRSTSDRSAQDSIRELRALTDRLLTNRSSLLDGNGSFEASCHLPLSGSQSHLLADLVTIFVPHSTWWLTREEKDWWALYGVRGEASGPRVTVCISATSDRDVLP